MQFAPIGTYVTGDEEVKLQACDNGNRAKLDDMITEYQLFHERWIEGLKRLRDKEPATDRTVNANGSEDMVRVWQVAAAVDKPVVCDMSRCLFSFLGTVCRHVQC